MGGLVAQIERQLFFLVADRQLAIEASFLQKHGAPAEPMMLRHFLDQLGFKRAVDLVLGAEASAEVFEFLLLFPRQDGEDPLRRQERP